MEILQGARNKQEQQALVHELSRYWVAHLESGDTLQAFSWCEAFHLSHGVGIFDCLIAAVAVRLGKTLYSFNLKHYQVIPNLDVRQPYEI
jgi:predicted nucleic acid-binding protein